MLVVVAHPDDEVLWFAGAILRTVEPVTVLCCSLSSKHPTTDYLARSCVALGVSKWLCSPEIAKWDKPLSLEWLSAQDLDDEHILTHNSVGEYGHPDHIAVHKHVVSRAKGLVMVSGRGLTDGYWIELSADHAAKKLAALMAYDVMYKHETGEKPDLLKWRLLLHTYYGSDLRAFRRESYAWLGE